MGATGAMGAPGLAFETWEAKDAVTVLGHCSSNQSVTARTSNEKDQ